MYFEFYLDDLEIEEPQGFADIVLNMKRDDTWHGIFFEASTSELAFYGVAAEYLKDKKATQGLKSDVTFKALQACGIYDELETILEGKLDFGKYTESCGNTCLVKIPVEQIGCLMTLRNRYDQKVDLDATTTFNKMSALQLYDKLNFEMELPAKELQAAVDGSVAEEGYEIELGSNLSIAFARPEYSIERYNNITTGQLSGGFNCQGPSLCFDFITPQLLFEDDIACFDGNFTYTSRMKGRFILPADGALVNIQHKIWKWDGVGNLYDDGELVQEGNIWFTDPATNGPLTVEFDNTLSGTTTIELGIGFYAVIELQYISPTSSIVFDKESFITINALKVCPPTDANVYAINETLSRITEAITDNCLKVKSDYYGRTDSQPYTSAEDGCGSLRVTTSGLKIRKAPTPAFFASLKDMFDGLRGIDNIGMGIEDNPFIPGFSCS